MIKKKRNFKGKREDLYLHKTRLREKLKTVPVECLMSHNGLSIKDSTSKVATTCKQHDTHSPPIIIRINKTPQPLGDITLGQAPNTIITNRNSSSSVRNPFSLVHDQAFPDGNLVTASKTDKKLLFIDRTMEEEQGGVSWLSFVL